MKARLSPQRGEIATILTIASLVVVAVGALLGNKLTQTQTLQSQAARCAVGELSGPKSGRDCSGASGQKITCGMRVIADTFNVEEIVRSGKTYLRIEGNFCYTSDLTSGANKGKLYITTNHPKKPACYKVLAIDTHASFSSGTMPLCDQTGQWAKLNPRLPIPDRFRGPDKTNRFDFTVEKPVTGCLYLNTTTEGSQGGGGADENFDIWNDPRLCNNVTPPPPTTILTPTGEIPTPTPCGQPGRCPTNTPTPTDSIGRVCNSICTGVGQCGGGNICVEVGGGIMRCRNPRNLSDPECRETTLTITPPPPTTITPPPVCKFGVNTYIAGDECQLGTIRGFKGARYVCYDGTAGTLGNATTCKTSEEWQRLANVACEGKANYPYCLTPTPTGATPPPTGTELKCDDVCNPPAGLSCPTDLVCVEISGAMRCRKFSNINDPSCRETTITPPPPTTTEPTISIVQGCVFNPINFVMVRDGSGNLSPLRSPDTSIWGSVNDKVRIELRNKDTAIDWNDFDSNGEFHPCKNQPGGYCTITKSTCCGKGSNQYNIVTGDIAQVLLHYDTSKYKVVQHCYNNSLDRSRDLNNCTNVNNDPLITNLPVKCGEQFRYGWILEEKNGGGGSCPLMNNGCKPGDVRADVKNGSSTRATIDWDYPSNCPALKAGVDKFWIDVVDEDNKIVCSKSVIADESDTHTECKLGRDRERQIDRDITEWEDGMVYRASVYTVQTADVSCRIGATSPNFSKPGDGGNGGENPDDRRSHQLDVWENGSQGDDCYIAADTATGTNQKNATHCRTSRNPTANGLDELQSKYANRTGRTLQMKWQINSCPGKLLDELGGVCNDYVAASGENISLPNGKMLVCTWNNPKDNPNVTCEIKDIDFEGGNGGNNPPPPPPSEKVTIKGSITVDVSGLPANGRIETVGVNCEMGKGCRQTAIAVRRGLLSVWDYSFVFFKNGGPYTIRPFVEYRNAAGLLVSQRNSVEYGDHFLTVDPSDSSNRNFTIRIKPAVTTTGIMRLGGTVTVNYDNAFVKAVKVEYSGTVCTPGKPCSGEINAKQVSGSGNQWTYAIELPEVRGDQYKIRAYAISAPTGGGADKKDLDPATGYAQVSAEGTQTKNFAITVGNSITQNVTISGFVTFNTGRSTAIKEVKVDLLSLTCGRGSDCRVASVKAEKTGDRNQYKYTASVPSITGKYGIIASVVYFVGDAGQTESASTDGKDTVSGNASSIKNLSVVIPSFTSRNYLISSCDVNGDDACNTIDYIQVSQHLGQRGANLSWDLNGDRKVDGADVSIVLNNL